MVYAHTTPCCFMEGEQAPPSVGEQLADVSTFFELADVLRIAALKRDTLAAALPQLNDVLYRIDTIGYEHNKFYPITYHLLSLSNISRDAIVLPFPFVTVVYFQETNTLELRTYDGRVANAHIHFPTEYIVSDVEFGYHTDGVLCLRTMTFGNKNPRHIHFYFSSLIVSTVDVAYDLCSAWKHRGEYLTPACLKTTHGDVKLQRKVSLLVRDPISAYTAAAYGWEI